MITRRGILGGLGLLLAAPAIVRADNLMRLKGVIVPRYVASDRIWAGNVVVKNEYGWWENASGGLADFMNRHLGVAMSNADYGDPVGICLNGFASANIARPIHAR